MPYRPGILQVQRVSGLVIRTCVHDSCTHDEISVLALTYSLTVGRLVRRNDRVAGSSVGDGRVAFSPVEVYSAPVESAQNIIRLPLPEETALEGGAGVVIHVLQIPVLDDGEDLQVLARHLPGAVDVPFLPILLDGDKALAFDSGTEA